MASYAAPIAHVPATVRAAASSPSAIKYEPRTMGCSVQPKWMACESLGNVRLIDTIDPPNSPAFLSSQQFVPGCSACPRPSTSPHRIYCLWLHQQGKGW